MRAGLYPGGAPSFCTAMVGHRSSVGPPAAVPLFPLDVPYGHVTLPACGYFCLHAISGCAEQAGTPKRNVGF